MYSGADPGFQVRGDALKKIAPSRGRRENFWGISCEKSRFYAKKSYFSNFRGRGGGGGREVFWGISCEKSRFYAKKIIFLPILGGARAGCAPPPPPPPPLNPPLVLDAMFWLVSFKYKISTWKFYDRQVRMIHYKVWYKCSHY